MQAPLPSTARVFEAIASMADNHWKSLTVPIGWGKLTGLSYGEGPIVLCLHGWLDNAASFVPLLPRLPSGFRYVAIDMAGHGFSDHRPEGTFYHYFDYLSDLQALLDALSLDTVTMLAHSLGGTLASVFAACFPKRVSRMVLFESLGPLARKAAEAPERVRGFLASARRLRSTPIGHYRNLDAAIAARLRATQMTEPAARLIVERNAIVGEDGVRWRSDRRLLLPGATSLTEEQALAFLRDVKCPTLLIRAEHGLPVDKAVWEQRRAAVSGLQTVMVPGNHHVHMDAPEAVAPHVAPFLTGQIQ